MSSNTSKDKKPNVAKYKATSVKLKPKSKAMADIMIEDPKISKTEAYLRTHNTTNRATARAEAAKLTAKPSFQIYTQEHVDAAKTTIVKLSKSATNESIQLKASQDILDRNEGKALQKQITENHNLNVNVEASEETAELFNKFMRENTIQ